MYKASIELSNKLLDGTLDMYCIRMVQLKLNCKVNDIFIGISNMDSKYACQLTVEAIKRLNKLSEEDIVKLYISEREYIQAENFILMFSFIAKLIDKCMPINNKNITENEFEEIPEEYTTKEDWDFDYMEFLWKSKLNREENFWTVTPKNFFSQMDIYKISNNIKDESEVEYI